MHFLLASCKKTKNKIKINNVIVYFFVIPCNLNDFATDSLIKIIINIVDIKQIYYQRKCKGILLADIEVFSGFILQIF